MARWALIRGNTVATIIDQEVEPAIGGTWVDVTGLHVGPGFTYDGGTFTAPAATVSLTQREFIQRFTAAEREALENKAQTGTQGVKDKIAAFKTYIQTGGRVELNDDYIIAAVMQMEAAGVIAAGRAAVILA
ncbi:MAG: hypothetical protein HYZ20_19560 [Burkholderiales bacterium]|nr:hypothetical protein [Burkholderiales bacterium]